MYVYLQACELGLKDGQQKKLVNSLFNSLVKSEKKRKWWTNPVKMLITDQQVF